MWLTREIRVLAVFSLQRKTGPAFANGAARQVLFRSRGMIPHRSRRSNVFSFGSKKGIRSMWALNLGRRRAGQSDRKWVVKPHCVPPFLNELSRLATPVGGVADFAFPDSNGGLHGYVQLLPESPYSIRIHRLWTIERGRGSGSIILATVCDLADRHGVELLLKVAPLGRKPYPMSADQLTAWYKRHGFDGRRRRLRRSPREVDPARFAPSHASSSICVV